MDDVEEVEGYKPDPGFEEDSRPPLADIGLSDSTELWLIQWPLNELPDFNGQELSLSLDRDGCLGSFKASSGRAYESAALLKSKRQQFSFPLNRKQRLVNFPFLLSLSTLDYKMNVGKISRRVSLVHYPDPKELEKQEAEKKSKRSYHMSAGSSLMNSSLHSGTTTPGSKLRDSHLSKGHAASTHSRKHKSSLSEAGEQSNTKRRRMHNRSGSTDRSMLDSGRGHSGHTYSGSSGLSHQGKLDEISNE